MSKFKSFSDSETFVPIPDSFFRHLLNEIEDVDELKITLHAIWRIDRMDGPFRALRESDFDAADLGLTAEEVGAGLEKAVRRGSLLKVRKDAVYYFLNSPRGRAAAEAFAKGQGRPAGTSSTPMERPNVFKLYEENIGPLTPLLADALRDAEETYPGEWLTDAIELAVKNNKRSWKYCEAILKRWKEEGRGEKQDRRDDQAARQRDVEDKIKKFVGGRAGK